MTLFRKSNPFLSLAFSWKWLERDRSNILLTELLVCSSAKWKLHLTLILWFKLNFRLTRGPTGSAALKLNPTAPKRRWTINFSSPLSTTYCQVLLGLKINSVVSQCRHWCWSYSRTLWENGEVTDFVGSEGAAGRRRRVVILWALSL